MKSREELQCKGKKQYRDAMAVKIAIARAGRMGQLGSEDRMSIYKCSFCGFWHMGHSIGGVPWYKIWD